MKTTLDAAGQIVIPEEILRQAGLEPGMLLDVRFCNGRIEIELESAPMRLEWDGHVLVAVPTGPAPTITTDDVEAIREAILDERSGLCSP